MENTDENRPAGAPPTDLPAQTENIAYSADELIDCGRCARRNPPNRLKCLYCGAELEFSDRQSRAVKPVLRRLEAWEKGFNLIYVPGAQTELDDRQFKDIGRMTRIEKEALRKLFAAGRPLPVARAESEKEAAIVGERLSELGVETRLLSDETLAAESAPLRLRGLEFAGDTISLKLFNTDEIFEIPRGDLALIVTGSIFEKRVEATEKRRRKSENALLNATETATDEKVLDVYTKMNETGFRIGQKGFDFSCLGADKSLLAAENIDRLTKKLEAFAPEAKLVEDYMQIRPLLGAVWEISERKDSKGLVRERFGRFNLGNVTTVSNSEQFTKYSRMLRNLL